ncbi:undecaprenyl-phosphate glucose phosphotransferase [Polymorphobacter fuscus]|uniref:Undecaprenyl-phosphate glucose phosphotransferase n=1 Tax=Sandarakinorhabdus fusca TaxID=1439888 RepID=A0A7C9GQK6_9SPHN|nr:undecaprenyl-phosphate glucose phosphotransferase [Polymorphobacter fuscus]KAB7648922.1 undecaprenyl-phosphate glucose phosphotransferase [Polymorphobacter fuscus]MQT16511.1 undecaprenyl-phosphate glucose phosphotransferase [Polymorphobacter fuscus]NJC07199.1 Undecaprenyl-phosphate glucose phosphotransferase [Polymorphobacter fuscus]
MNDPQVNLYRQAERSGGRAGLPLDVATFAVRIVEFLVVLGSGSLAILLIHNGLTESEVAVHLRVVLITGIAFAVLAESLGCYDLDAQFSLRMAWQRVATSWLTSALFMMTLGFILKASDSVSRSWAGGWFAAGGLALLLSRGATTVWVRRLKNRGTFNQRVAVFGAGPQGVRFADYVLKHDRLTISLVGFFDDRRDGRVPSAAATVPVLGNLSALISLIRDGRVDQVVVALPWSAEARLQQVVSRLALTPVKIRLAPDLASFAFARRPIVVLGDIPMLTLFERPISGMDAALKLVEDKLLTLTILAFTWPILLAIAIAVKLDSPGPVFFRQPREGFNNRPFRVFKFRTMYHNRSEFDAIQQASRSDPRVTRVGRILRRTSLDELPQLFNVLNGDMSLVGPRPHAASTRAGGRLFSDVVASYAARHKVKPGITGWAQVCGWRGETDTEEKLVKRLEHDLHYIENWSLAFDFYILFRTIGSVLLPKNAF